MSAMNVLSPGIDLLNKLIFTHKFQLILAIFLIPLIYATWVIYNDNRQVIEVIDHQKDGISVVQALHPLRIQAAKHRGVSAQWISGNEAALDKLKQLEAEMDDKLNKASTSISQHLYSKSSNKKFKQILKRWDKLKHQDLNKSSSFTDHTLWIADTTNLINALAGESKLVLDNHIDSYMLMQLLVFDIPSLQEMLGQVRGLGAGVATKGSFDADSFIAVSTLYKNIDDAQSLLNNHFAFIERNNKQLAQSIQAAISSANDAVLTFKGITKNQLLDPDKPTINGVDYFSAGTSAITSVAKLYQLGSQRYLELLIDNRTDVENHLLLILIIFGSMVFVGVYLLFCLKVAVDVNAHVTQKMAFNMQDGQLAGKFESKSNDELGDTIRSLSLGFSTLTGVVSEVRSHSSALTQSSNSLQAVSSDVNKSGLDQKRRVEVIVTAATELAATAKEVAVHCDSAAKETVLAQGKADEGAQRSTASASIIRELAQSIRTAGDEISQLAQQASSISTVIDVIKAIAEQTNLLALNAAIEAARAGEQGRGFAVVADEVRTLANRTQVSTNEIEATISSLQEVAEQAVTAMETACGQADTGEAEAVRTGEVLSEIETAVNQVTALIEQVATAGVQQAGAAEEIAQNIVLVDNASTTLVEKAESVSVIADEVGSGSERLAKTMSHFKV